MFILFIILFVAAWAVWVAWETNKNGIDLNGCNQNCNQGRTCTCGWPGTEEKCINNWPFPKDKP